MYAEGRGVARDETEAVRLYPAGGRAGAWPWARATWDSCTPRGGVWPRMRPKRCASIRQAAAQGLAAAQGRLGLMYAEGRGVAKDETEAVRLFQQAAAQGYAMGQYGMGLMYEQGWGVARDLVEAQRLFTQAAETASFASDRT